MVARQTAREVGSASGSGLSGGRGRRRSRRPRPVSPTDSEAQAGKGRGVGAEAQAGKGRGVGASGLGSYAKRARAQGGLQGTRSQRSERERERGSGTGRGRGGATNRSHKETNGRDRDMLPSRTAAAEPGNYQGTLTPRGSSLRLSSPSEPGHRMAARAQLRREQAEQVQRKLDSEQESKAGADRRASYRVHGAAAAHLKASKPSPNPHSRAAVSQSPSHGQHYGSPEGRDAGVLRASIPVAVSLPVLGPGLAPTGRGMGSGHISAGSQRGGLGSGIGNQVDAWGLAS